MVKLNGVIALLDTILCPATGSASSGFRTEAVIDFRVVSEAGLLDRPTSDERTNLGTAASPC